MLTEAACCSSVSRPRGNPACWDGMFAFEDCCPPPSETRALPPALRPSCWHGRLSEEACCDLAYGPRGHLGCWDHLGQYEDCCPASSTTTTTPTFEVGHCWFGSVTEEFCCSAIHGARGSQHCWDEFYTFDKCCQLAVGEFREEEEEEEQQGASDPATSDLKFAHCVVGAARAFVAPCVRDALVRNFISRLPGEQRLFIYLSEDSSGELRDQRDRPVSLKRQDLQLPTVSVEGLHALVRTMNPDAYEISNRVRYPACHAARVPQGHKDHKLSWPRVMWSNVRECFRLVQEYEVKHRMMFDFVTRLRPDAVFFAPMPRINSTLLRPRLGVRSLTMLIPRGGLVGKGLWSSNDHVAILPRALAPRYFRDISARLDDCMHGRNFSRAVTGQLRGGHHSDMWRFRPSIRGGRGNLVSEDIEHGPGFAYFQVGLRYRHIDWPYGLSARSCEADDPADDDAGGPAPQGGLRAEPGVWVCVTPLQCNRLAWTMMREGPFHNIQELTRRCQRWRCQNKLPDESTGPR
mmetsp:Transcript_82686/g.215393  ORF Transcript_82686/g.215393 Transcript_82686/m.215393 type:complete len:519 (+) Transcript_82686:2-1558(+)